ncbi:inosine-5'-monophosphate dehydrogenase [Peptococcaceae bacterium CEB3]|nr:inosine-5'-monophosphate dehydrogenase [Peptococcaceae bacterium CEB3]
MYVRQFMSTPVITVHPNDTIADTIALMREKKINRCPVVEKGRVVGLVTDGDLREISPSPATTLSIFELNYLVAKTAIREVAVKKVVTCTPDTLLEDAALLMREHKIGGLPVTENGQLAGIITQTDVFDAFLDALGFRSPGQRIVVETKDEVGVISDMSETIKNYNVNIASLTMFHRSGDIVQILARLNGTRADEAIQALIAKGYRIE